MQLPDSPRLKFRLLSEGDAPHVLATAADQDVMRYISGKPRTEAEALAEMQRWLRLNDGEHGLFIAEEKENGAFVGFFILRELEQTGLTETGFRLPKHQWGKGYATEGAKAVLGHAFINLKRESVVAVVEEGNTASRKVLEKLGFHEKGLCYHYGADLLLYELSKDIYFLKLS